jgi:hypothetical protein
MRSLVFAQRHHYGGPLRNDDNDVATRGPPMTVINKSPPADTNGSAC